jgi:hypothetical protein
MKMLTCVTRIPLTLLSTFRISSEMPSAKKAFEGSGLMFSNANTAIGGNAGQCCGASIRLLV